MRWEQTEFLLKGIYLGLLLAIALYKPTWVQLGQVALFSVGGLALLLGVAAARKIREGYRVRGRLIGFLLFLILENPGMVYVGLILGLTLGTYTTFKPEEGTVAPPEQAWYLAGPMLGGAVLGFVFWLLRHVRDRKARLWVGLALACVLVGGAVALMQLRPDLIHPEQQRMVGILLLLGIPGFYLLTFASLVEESEIEIAAICAALGVGLFILGEDISPAFRIVALAIPLALYFTYTRNVLPGLRVFKHALRGLSYAMVGQFRPALGSLNRALVLNPNHTLARETLWNVHRRMDVDELKNDPEALALVNFNLCLERVAWLLLLDKPKSEQIQEAVRLLDLISSQRPVLEPACAYWRAVAALHQGKVDEAGPQLRSVLIPPAEDTPQRRAVLFQAWQLALVLHPAMRRTVGEPLLQEAGRRMEAIAAVERRLAAKPGDPEAWDLKRTLYSELTEGEYNRGEGLPSADFDYSYVQQLGLALIEDGQRWRRGCEYLRIAARGLAAEGPMIFLQIGQVHEKWGDKGGLWENYEEAIVCARQVGVANLKAEDREKLFAAVKQLGEERMQQKLYDGALAAFKFYTQFEKAGLETYRTLAELFERKAEIWPALHCTEHALTYNATDKDLVERKDRYYYSIQPAEVKQRWEEVHKWFDFDYCVDKTRWLLERYQNNLELLDWAGHLAELANAAKPDSVTARLLRARVRRARGEIGEAATMLEEIRQHKPEKFAAGDEEAWYLSHRILGDMYLDEKPDQAVLCFQEFRKSERAGADTMFKLGRAYENIGDLARAGRCYEQVTAYEDHPLFYEARAGLERVKRNP